MERWTERVAKLADEIHTLTEGDINMILVWRDEDGEVTAYTAHSLAEVEAFLAHVATPREVH